MTAEDLDPRRRKTPSPALPAGDSEGAGSPKWPLVPLGEVLTHKKREIRVDTTREYALLGAHWYAKGLYI